MLAVLRKGFILGLSIAAPVGPVGVLCMRRSIAQGWRWVPGSFLVSNMPGPSSLKGETMQG